MKKTLFQGKAGFPNYYNNKNNNNNKHNVDKNSFLLLKNSLLIYSAQRLGHEIYIQVAKNER